VGGIVLNCRDITERGRLERMLTYHAFHDGLTDLPNRMFFMRRLQEVMDEVGDDRLVAVYLIDVDRFKAINDQLGHPAGDALLREIAGRLGAALPDATVARLGGDEFAALMTVSNEAEAVAAARAIVGQFESPFRYEGARTPISGSAGVALAARSQHRSVSELVRAADVALYRVKSEGGAAFILADAALEAAWMQRRFLERDILSATDNGELRLLYQPIFALDTHEIVGVEALVRWMHPERGLILPDQFIPIAESSEAIAEIDRWVRTEAARQIDQWRKLGMKLHPDFSIRLNLSAVELADPNLVETVQATLQRYDAPPGMIEFEVTESTLVRDVGGAAEQLRLLKDAGFTIAIDDFGTGYSSLAYLSSLPIDTLKIDRTFTSGLVESEATRAVVRGVISMARSLGHDVVGEGIETETQQRALIELGCQLGQGYHLSRPVDARAIERMIDRPRAARRPAA
jgi:diguanylate cyclase (GGDEF)-like protein